MQSAHFYTGQLFIPTGEGSDYLLLQTYSLSLEGL